MRCENHIAHPGAYIALDRFIDNRHPVRILSIDGSTEYRNDIDYHASDSVMVEIFQDGTIKKGQEVRVCYKSTGQRRGGL